MSVTPARPTEPDVLVAGAGPVGLTAAHELARHGLRVRLVDVAAGPATTSRAVATHPRTLETYDQMGVADRIIARGLRVEAFTMYSNGRRLVRLDADYSQMPTRFPFTVAIDQTLTEEVLREAVAERGVTIEWGTEVTGFTADDDGVTVTLRHAGGSTEQTRAGWLVGCDGGHSTVRKVLGLPLLGDSNETWLIADATVDTELPRNSIYWIRAEGGTLMMAPLPGERRWRMLDTVDVVDAGPAAVAARFSRKLTAGVGSAVRVSPPGWTSVFTAQQRMVPTMRGGRVFVAGDAAHVHSPASGQGMNTGIQEAHNLAWKLAMVHRGQADPALLDSYDAERVPVGRDLLGSTRKATALVALRNRLAGVALPVVFGVVRRVPALRVRGQRTALGRVSGLNVGYPDSPLTVPSTSDSGPAPGERVVQLHPSDAASPGCAELVTLLRASRWTLLSAGPLPAAAAEFAAARRGWLDVRVVLRRPDGEPGALADPDGRLAGALGLAPGGYLLVRPDGYVAARGTHAGTGELAAALRPLRPAAPVPVP
jgi:6-methylpretetramide 4-monooxygenase / 4-hydroxy-6-methylpretetramide 12a-monooxygenase